MARKSAQLDDVEKEDLFSIQENVNTWFVNFFLCQNDKCRKNEVHYNAAQKDFFSISKRQGFKASVCLTPRAWVEKSGETRTWRKKLLIVQRRHYWRETRSEDSVVVGDGKLWRGRGGGLYLGLVTHPTHSGSLRMDFVLIELKQTRQKRVRINLGEIRERLARTGFCKSVRVCVDIYVCVVLCI